MTEAPTPMPAPVPLVLLAGYLGAGKTTLLRELLPLLRKQGLVPHVILNDYRNALIDAQTLEGLADSVSPITGSCVCCDSRDDLLDTLSRLPLTPRSILLLEANGSADMPELIELLTADRKTRRYTLPIQLTVIDAKRWQKRCWHNLMEEAQTRTANALFLSRVGEVAPARLEKVRADLVARAPRATWPTLEAFAVHLRNLVETTGLLPPRRFAPPVLGGRSIQRASAHAHHHFASMEIPLSCRVTERDLESFLVALPPEVIRAKGVAFMTGDPLRAVLFQKVEGRERPAFMDLTRPERLDPVAVLIGVQCPREHILELVHRHLGIKLELEHEENTHDHT